MRYFFVLFLFTSQSLFGQSVLNKKIDFAANHLSIPEAIRGLEEVTQTEIAFSSSFFKNYSPVNLQFQDESVSEILETLLTNTGVTFKTSGNRILLYREIIQQYTISGYVEEIGSGERLIAAAIYSPGLGLGTITNEYGFYSLTLPAGQHQLRCSYLGFKEETWQLDLQKSQQQFIQLQNHNMLAEVVVTPDSLENPYFISQTDEYYQLSPDLITLQPGLGGENDPVRAAHILPGVQAGSDGLSGIQVRGSDNGHNLMLLDGVPIYIPYHLLGMISIYNTSTVQSAKLLTGNFSARYGGSLASVFDVRTREGNRYEWQGEAGLNLTNVQLLLEGPLKKEKSSILVAFRQKHSAFFFEPVLGETVLLPSEEKLGSNYYDLNVKWNYKFSAKDRIYLSFYKGNDLMGSEFEEENEDFEIEAEADITWGNTIAAFRWNHLFNDKLFANLTFTNSFNNFRYSTFLYGSALDILETDELLFYNVESENSDIGLRLDFDYLPNASHKIRFGGGFSDRYFAPGIHSFDEESEEIEEEDLGSISDFDSLTIVKNFEADELYLYVEDKIQIGDKSELKLGLRGTSFISTEAEYLEFEPRIEFATQITPQVQWTIGGSRMVQYLHLVSSSAIQLPTDLWVPSNAQIRPQIAYLGETYLKASINEHTYLSLGVYFRSMENLYTLPDFTTTNVVVLEDIGDLLLEGTGKSKGIELFVEHHKERNGLIASYVLSDASRSFSWSNNDDSFPADFDARHQLKFFYYQKTGRRFQCSINWTYQSPSPQIYLAAPGFDDEFGVIEPTVETERNELRSKASHRLDLNFSYKISKTVLSHEFKLGASNLYNRQNVAFYEAEREDSSAGFSSFPITAIPFLPSFSYRLKF